MRSASAWCWTICPPTRPAHFIKPSRLPTPQRLLNRLEFHYVPKHASRLNMVEIEIGVLRGQSLDRRIDSKERLVSKLPPGSGSAIHHASA
jgi:DDE superfamily endonuclease